MGTSTNALCTVPLWLAMVWCEKMLQGGAGLSSVDPEGIEFGLAQVEGQSDIASF